MILTNPRDPEVGIITTASLVFPLRRQRPAKSSDLKAKIASWRCFRKAWLGALRPQHHELPVAVDPAALLCGARHAGSLGFPETEIRQMFPSSAHDRFVHDNF